MHEQVANKLLIDAPQADALSTCFWYSKEDSLFVLLVLICTRTDCPSD